VVVAEAKPIVQERTDLLTEVLNALLEAQDSYAKDWYEMVHKRRLAPANLPAQQGL
jgi:hypothetical protein